MHIQRDWERPRIRQSEANSIRQRLSDTPSQELREAVKRLRIPDRRPAFNPPITDDKGCIWVPRYWTLAMTEGKLIDEVFDIFSSDGIWIGTEVFEEAPDLIQEGCAYIVKSSPVRLERVRLHPLVPELGGSPKILN